MNIFDEAVAAYAASYLLLGGDYADCALSKQFCLASQANSQVMANEAAKRYAQEFNDFMNRKESAVNVRVVEKPVLLLG